MPAPDYRSAPGHYLKGLHAQRWPAVSKIYQPNRTISDLGRSETHMTSQYRGDMRLGMICKAAIRRKCSGLTKDAAEYVFDV
eukprot:scaffold363509_cov18-Prasinocladus_malaysianus.AAC.1